MQCEIYFFGIFNLIVLIQIFICEHVPSQRLSALCAYTQSLLVRTMGPCVLYGLGNHSSFINSHSNMYEAE